MILDDELGSKGKKAGFIYYTRASQNLIVWTEINHRNT
jgi:hypothetical protein